MSDWVGIPADLFSCVAADKILYNGKRGGLDIECKTLNREVLDSNPSSARLSH